MREGEREIKDADAMLADALERVADLEKAMIGKDKKIAEFTEQRERPTTFGEPISDDRLARIRDFLSRFPNQTAGMELLNEVDRLSCEAC